MLLSDIQQAGQRPLMAVVEVVQPPDCPPQAITMNRLDGFFMNAFFWLIFAVG
jgi:hypothetical protein